ncbi:MAG: ROK family protein [Williamsia sp.]|nr:ROK family protein [Williamsia sp.]
MEPDNLFLGIEIGGTKLQLVVADASMRICQRLRYAIDPARGAEHIRSQIRDAWKAIASPDRIAAIGVGFGGPVDWKRGTIRVSHQIAGWGDFNLLQWLQELTGKPVMVENDANTAALAEALYGAGHGFERVFYMTIGSGIGGGMIVQEAIYHGRIPGEVEVGHLRLNREGDTLESMCSGWAVNKKVRAYIDQHPGSLLAQLHASPSAPEATALQPALESGDAAAKQITGEIADHLAFALSHVVHLFHPDIIIIGGGLSLLKESILRPVSQQLARYVMHAFLPPPPVQVASLEEDVVPIGALELAKRLVVN